MSKDINKEIEETAEVLHKSEQSPKERLFETIRQLGPEGIKAKLPTLEKAEKELLVGALEEMKKAVEMDDAYEVGYHKGDVYKDTVIQEDKADDDADEKLVKPEAAKHNHQGDVTPEGREGQVIKGEGIDIADDAEETADEAVAKVAKKKKKMKKSEADELIEQLKKSDEMLKTMVYKMCGMGKGKDYIMDKCMAKGLDGEKVSGMIDSAMAEHNKKMHQGDKGIKKSEEAPAEETVEKGKMKDKMLAEEEQSKDELDKLQKEKDRGDKKRPEALKVEKENKDAQDKVDDLGQGKMKKAMWGGENDLLKANTGGRNHHFSVNGYYDEVIAKAEGNEGEEKLAKSEDSEKKEDDVNDIIEKGGDASRDEVIAKSMIEANKEKISGKFYKSFEDNEIAQALGLTEEEAKKILGD